MAAKRATFQNGSKAIRLLLLAAQSTALVTAWAIWNPRGILWLALVYVLATWIVAWGISLWIYVACSLAPLSNLLGASLKASAIAMWLVPGTLLLASRSRLAVAAGLAAVIYSSRLLASSRAPKGETIQVSRCARKSRPLLFRGQPEQPVFWRETVPTMLGALALQTGIYALAVDYPLLAAVSFATVTAIWIAMAIARGAMEARTEPRMPYSGLVILLTLLLTVTLTAALVQTEIVLESLGAGAGATETAETPAITRRVLQRLAHVPPEPAPSKVEVAASRAEVTRIVGRTAFPVWCCVPSQSGASGPVAWVAASALVRAAARDSVYGRVSLVPNEFGQPAQAGDSGDRDAAGESVRDDRRRADRDRSGADVRPAH